MSRKSEDPSRRSMTTGEIFLRSEPSGDLLQRLREEIEKMGRLYDSQLREVRTSIKSIYDKKVKMTTKDENVKNPIVIPDTRIDQAKR